MRLCLIFDLDGTLVDSESLCNQAFLDLLPELDSSVADLTRRYRGRKLAEILSDIESRLGTELPDNFEERYRSRVADLFRFHLKPTPGVEQMLDALPNPRCIASSGPVEKIAQALSVCGLAEYFGEVFSSYEIGSWKPDPGLFLHAAREMRFQPRECLAIEDSPVGIVAAKAAGMRVFQYTPCEMREPTEADAQFGDMADLPSLVRRLEKSC